MIFLYSNNENTVSFKQWGIDVNNKIFESNQVANAT